MLLKSNTTETEMKMNNDDTIIEKEKVTMNSISLQFKKSANITTINCYHLQEPNELMTLFGAKGKWQLIHSQPINSEINHISFHYLESSDQYKVEFCENQQIITEHCYRCLDGDIDYDLSGDSIAMIVKIFGLSSALYISPTIFDLNFNKNMSMDWIIESNHDWMWYAIPNYAKIDASFLKILILNGLFSLPHGSVAQKLTNHFGKEADKNAKIKMLIARYTELVMLCPNPMKRQVIDLRVEKDKKIKYNDIEMIKKDDNDDNDDNKDQNKKQNNNNNKYKINWSRNKKLKRYKKDFYLSVNYKFKENLKLCKDYHIEKEIWMKQKEKEKEKEKEEKKEKEKEKDENKNENDGDKEDGTWITDNFIDILDELRLNENNNDILKFVTFELWEKQTNEIVAASFSYIIGSILCDYTFMTLKRDNRSCGSILTKVIGDILQRTHYDIWYWGFRLEYMSDYDKYGGKEIQRKEFANILKNSCKQQPNIINYNNQTVLDIIEFIKNGKALIEPLPQWIEE